MALRRTAACRRNDEDFIGRDRSSSARREIRGLKGVDQPAGAPGAVRRDQTAPCATLIVLHAAGSPDVHPVALTLVSSDSESMGSKVSIEQSSG